MLKSSFDGGQPIILLVAVYRETLNTTQIFVAMVMWSISDDEVGGRLDGEKSVWFARKRLPGEVDVLFELRKLQEFQVLIC